MFCLRSNGWYNSSIPTRIRLHTHIKFCPRKWTYTLRAKSIQELMSHAKCHTLVNLWLTSKIYNHRRLLKHTRQPLHISNIDSVIFSLYLTQFLHSDKYSLRSTIPTKSKTVKCHDDKQLSLQECMPRSHDINNYIKLQIYFRFKSPLTSTM